MVGPVNCVYNQPIDLYRVQVQLYFILMKVCSSLQVCLDLSSNFTFFKSSHEVITSDLVLRVKLNNDPRFNQFTIHPVYDRKI